MSVQNHFIEQIVRFRKSVERVEQSAENILKSLFLNVENLDQNRHGRFAVTRGRGSLR
jgi:hypothetical protein